jgi:hypothetical protein
MGVCGPSAERVNYAVDAVERVVTINERTRFAEWTRDEFSEAGCAARIRWWRVMEQFGVRYPMLSDAVAYIEPTFQLPPEVERAVEAAAIPRARNISSRLAVAFVKWDRCPTTAGHPNPYEPLVEIWEHGGSFSMEHGMFMDIYDAEGMTCGALTLMSASPVRKQGKPRKQRKKRLD